MKTTVAGLTLAIVFCALAIAQEAPPPAEGQTMTVNPSMQAQPTVIVGPPLEGHVVRGPNYSVARVIGPGKFWKDSALMHEIGVSDEQVRRIEKIFQDHRLDLIDLHAALEKQEAILEPLVEADQPDEKQVVAQIDKVAQARANLEKGNAQMLLAIRRVLTVDQWKKLRELPGVDTIHAEPYTRLPTVPPPGRRFEPQSTYPPAHP